MPSGQCEGTGLKRGQGHRLQGAPNGFASPQKSFQQMLI